MRKRIGLVLIALVLSGGISKAAYAERYVIINGKRLTLAEIMEVERLNCGPIPNGNYWVDMNSGIWGYANNPRPMGRVGDCCYNHCRRPSLSERGMLFSPYDWVR